MSDLRANLMLVASFLAIVSIAAILAIFNVDDAIQGFLFTTGGMFCKNISTAFDFEYGSSRGSKEKDQRTSS